jgi:heavy metal sensor kinase
MIFKSIRWRLQVWYGVILITVLAGFGATAYRFERARVLQNVDEELQLRVTALMHGLRDGGGPRGGPPDGRPPPEDGSRPPEGDEPPPPDRPYHLPVRDAGLFGGTGKNGFYFIIWRRDRTEMARSTNAPASVPQVSRNDTTGLEAPRTRGILREVYHTTPPGESILAGRSIDEDFNDLRKFAWGLGAVGGVVLLLGLAGGWWLAARAIRPIDDISATALKIAAGDLSQRIDVTDTENELGRLAGVLNSTFTRLEAAFAQQGQFTADAAHELRTPVAVILTQTQMALKRDRDASEYRQTLEACQRSAQRMKGLLESLLELARLDAGEEPLSRRSFDLAETTRECLELVRPLANDLRISSDLPPLKLTGDPQRLTQVITNLLTNAIHYNQPNGEVRVALARVNDTAVLSVSDTGQGISPADLPHVFERFYRADKARSNASGRNGLGLAISKAIVAAHGGTIEVTSELGKGATFTMRLPIEDGGGQTVRLT